MALANASARRRMVLLVACFWLLVSGCLFLVARFWLLVTRCSLPLRYHRPPPEATASAPATSTRNQQPATRDQTPGDRPTFQPARQGSSKTGVNLFPGRIV